MGLTCAETLVRNRVKDKLGWTVTQGRAANLTRPLNGRAACHYCGPCERGCITKSYFNSAFTTVADALETGRCTLIPNAMVYKVLMDPDRHRAKGVLYIDRVTRQAHEVYGRVVILCAQALESVRIMLNSKTTQDSAGLGNSSGVLGHYLMDHFGGAGATGELPEAMREPLVAGGPDRPTGIYVIRFRNTMAKKHPDFLRGYGFQGGGGSGFNWEAPGFGPELKKRIQDPVTTMGFGSFGECLPRFDNFVEIDESVVDTFGIPVLKIHMAWGENERKMRPDMAQSAAEMLAAAGARNIRAYVAGDEIPGYKIHELGIARMGKDPKTSVLSQYQQAWDVDNLFVMDAAGFTSGGCQNPTLTIMALAVRSTDFLLEEMKRGVL
jgi:choline dehydrogenase-like flavoprotein